MSFAIDPNPESRLPTKNGVFSHLFPRQNRISQAEIMEAKTKNKGQGRAEPAAAFVLGRGGPEKLH